MCCNFFYIIFQKSKRPRAKVLKLKTMTISRQCTFNNGIFLNLLSKNSNLLLYKFFIDYVQEKKQDPNLDPESDSGTRI